MITVLAWGLGPLTQEHHLISWPDGLENFSMEIKEKYTKPLSAPWIGHMLSDRKTAFWIVLTVIVAMFALFVVLTEFIPPNTNVANISDPGIRAEMDALRQAVWWTTIAMVMLPIMLLLIALAIYLFITGNPAPSVMKVPGQKRGLLGMGSRSKKVEASSTSDVLDLRYARGEITREQYLAMKADLAAHQASAGQVQLPQRL